LTSASARPDECIEIGSLEERSRLIACLLMRLD
jgi:hypothetical protein